MAYLLFRGSPARAVLFVSSLALIACAPGGGSEDSSSSSGSGESSDATATATAGSTTMMDASSEATGNDTSTTEMDGSDTATTDSSTGMTTLTDSGTGDSCEDFGNAFGEALEVTITNNSGVVQYIELADECNQRVIQRLTQGGEPLPWNSECWTCETMIAEGCLCPPMPGPPCFQSAGMKLDPGASYVTTLGTTTYVADEVPDMCVDAECATTCNRAIPLPAGTYDAAVTASPDITCDNVVCDCDASFEGWCFIESDGGLAGTPQAHSSAVVVPTSATTISIE